MMSDSGVAFGPGHRPDGLSPASGSSQSGVPNAEPLSMTVEGFLRLLDRALGAAVSQHGDAAKAFAWDVHTYIMEELAP
jgi:hypothetical protein